MGGKHLHIIVHAKNINEISIRWSRTASNWYMS